MVVTPGLRQDSVGRITTNLPHAIEYYEDGLNDITQMNRDWEQFNASQTNITCERLSETEFKVRTPRGNELTMRLHYQNRFIFFLLISPSSLFDQSPRLIPLSFHHPIPIQRIFMQIY